MFLLTGVCVWTELRNRSKRWWANQWRARSLDDTVSPNRSREQPQLWHHSRLLTRRALRWNKNQADTRAQPIGGGSSIKVFNLNQNQYMANFLLHLTDREERFRPFVFFGLGANSLDPDRSSVNGTTRFAASLGGGAKYNIGRHFGLRAQLKWSPTYITTTNGGYWCDPFWGGCWTVGNSHYLHEFDITGGFTLRF